MQPDTELIEVAVPAALYDALLAQGMTAEAIEAAAVRGALAGEVEA